MNTVKFIMAARCESAGRPNNEDNFQLADHLADSQWGFMADQVVDLDVKGALLVVCDGMGGMNAGEVASKLAVDTIKEWFSPERLTDDVIATSESIAGYIEKSIVAADERIKEEGRNDKEKEGMGSTIVLAWIIGQSAYVGWCGDSRAYCYHPADGLKRLSHDHSYVQSLVDAGMLSEELAFDHPNSNIITRCLGDPSQTAKPDVTEYLLRNGDAVMLCSDGLCGVLRDREIEAVMSEHAGSMAACRDALWDAARNAGWHDNVTIGLCRMISGCEQDATSPENAPAPKKTARKRTKMLIAGLILGIITAGIIAEIIMKMFF